MRRRISSTSTCAAIGEDDHHHSMISVSTLGGQHAIRHVGTGKPGSKAQAGSCEGEIPIVTKWRLIEIRPARSVSAKLVAAGRLLKRRKNSHRRADSTLAEPAADLSVVPGMGECPSVLAPAVRKAPGWHGHPLASHRLDQRLEIGRP